MEGFGVKADSKGLTPIFFGTKGGFRVAVIFEYIMQLTITEVNYSGRQNIETSS